MKLKMIIAVMFMLASSTAFADAMSVVITGLSVDKQYALKAYGDDLLLYKESKLVLRCLYDEQTHGIGNDGEPFALDIFQCEGDKTLGVKTFRDLERDGGWVSVVETINGKPKLTFNKQFFLTDKGL